MAFLSAVITNEEIKARMTLDHAIDCVEQAWKWHGEGKIIMPAKVTTEMSPLGPAGWFNSMPSYVQPLDMAGIKVVGGYYNNPSLGLPYIKSNILLIHPHTGQLRALMCGDWISDARTGAQPAIAMKYLAASTDVLTIIGAGNQAGYVVECIRRRHVMKELRVCDIKRNARETFVSRFTGASFQAVSYESIQDACIGADVIITITTANAPLVQEAWCKPGCLVLTMGSYTETAEDVPLHFDRIYLDSVSQGLHRGNLREMAQKGLVTEESIAAELPDIVAGKKEGRIKRNDRIVCELVGMGSTDLCIATEVYNAVIKNPSNTFFVDMMGKIQ